MSLHRPVLIGMNNVIIPNLEKTSGARGVVTSLIYAFVPRFSGMGLDSVIVIDQGPEARSLGRMSESYICIQNCREHSYAYSTCIRS